MTNNDMLDAHPHELGVQLTLSLIAAGCLGTASRTIACWIDEVGRELTPGQITRIWFAARDNTTITDALARI